MSYRPTGERGQARFKGLIALLVTAGIFYAAWRVVPVFVKRYEFQEAVRQEARFAAVREAEPMMVRQRLFEKAQEIGIPIKHEQIQVTPRTGGIRIVVRYNIPLQLIGYTRVLTFEASADTASAY